MTATGDTTNAGVNDPVVAPWGHRQGRTAGSFTPALVLRLRHRLRLRRRHTAPPQGRARAKLLQLKRVNAVRGHGATRGERTSREGATTGGANLTRFTLCPRLGPGFPVDGLGELQVLGVQILNFAGPRRVSEIHAGRNLPGRVRRTRAGRRRRDRYRRTRADRTIERQTGAFLAPFAPFGLSVKTPFQCLRGLFREAPRRRGVSPRRSTRGLWEPCSRP
jgi:hypothetical protein